jgi:FkbM family methyltransferase
LPDDATMMELGAYWSYYSLWFNKTIKNATNYCCEPDPANIELGKRNAAINDARNIHFIEAAAGFEDGKLMNFTPQEGDGKEDVRVRIRSVDGLAKEHNIARLDILHMDVQGVELEALRGAEQAIKNGTVRFIIISTHHYCVSRDPLTHEKCLDLIAQYGGHVIAAHAVHESFSGDGLIVGSFLEEDRHLRVTTSLNRMQDSLFRAYNRDIALLGTVTGVIGVK